MGNKIYENNLVTFFRNRYPESGQRENGLFGTYYGVEEEYNLLKNGAVIRDISPSAILKLTGEDTPDFIHRLSTNAVKDIKKGEKVNTVFTNEKGRILDRTVFINMGDHYLLAGSMFSAEKLEAWLENYIIMEDIKIENITGNFNVFGVTGEQAASFLTLFVGKELEMTEHGKVVSFVVEGAESSVYLFINGRYPEYRIVVKNDNTADVLNYMLDNHSIFNCGMIGETAYNIYRIENGIPEYPNELNTNYNPLEAGLTDEISFSKGCYIGQEVIARLDTYDKVQRELKGVIPEKETGEDIPLPLVYEGNDAGEITSITGSELPGRQLGLAYVRKKYSGNGTVPVIDSKNGKINIQITDLPLTK